ncbi:acyltransferase domain-containing protein, partial [Streptomyces sp. NPDC001508]|uniref:acyltransferase domain-containing protein n=1 Tax=Streptomyces sp. NPDC001508 TaxID=3154656 RepID=UPI00332F6C05
PAEGARPEPVDGARVELADGARREPAEGARPEPVDGARVELADGARREPAEGARPAPAERGRVEPAGGGAPGGIGAAVFTLTAPNAEALRRNLLVQADAAAARRVPLGPLARSSNRVKTGHRHRFATAATDTAELVARLRESAADPELLARLCGGPAGRPRIAFLFTGQGSQYPRMTAALHAQSPLYRHFLDEADTALLPHTGRSVRDLVLAGDEAVHSTRWTQPALFAVGYALGRTLTELGVRPGMLLGHSVGEFAAAVLARALPLDGAARLVAARGALMQELPAGGGMLAVRAARADLAEWIEAEPLVGVAAVNGPTATVLSGDLAALERVGAEIAAKGLTARRLQVSHAFHSPLMRPVLDRFAQIAAEVGGTVPEIPVYSTVRGRVLDGEAMDAPYWVEHIGATVLFGDAADALLAADPTHLVEIGPQPVLSGMVRRLDRPATGADPAQVLPVRGPDSAGRDLAEALAELYRGGVEPHWDAAYPARERIAHPLPPYAFSTRTRYWARHLVRSAETAAGRAAPDLVPHWDPETAPAPVRATDRPAGPADPVADAVLDAVRLVGGYAGTEIGPHDRLYEDLGFDSVMIMELKNRLETRLAGIGTLTVQDLLPRLSSVGDLVAFLRELGAIPARPGHHGDGAENQALGQAENQALREEERTA